MFILIAHATRSMNRANRFCPLGCCQIAGHHNAPSIVAQRSHSQKLQLIVMNRFGWATSSLLLPTPAQTHALPAFFVACPTSPSGSCNCASDSPTYDHQTGRQSSRKSDRIDDWVSLRFRHKQRCGRSRRPRDTRNRRLIQQLVASNRYPIRSNHARCQSRRDGRRHRGALP